MPLPTESAIEAYLNSDDYLRAQSVSARRISKSSFGTLADSIWSGQIDESAVQSAAAKMMKQMEREMLDQMCAAPYISPTQSVKTRGFPSNKPTDKQNKLLLLCN